MRYMGEKQGKRNERDGGANKAMRFRVFVGKQEWCFCSVYCVR